MAGSLRKVEGHLSRRVRRLVEWHGLPEYIAANHERRLERWDAKTNPGGYVALCTAENNLVWDLLAPKLTAPRRLPHSALGYDDMAGNEGFRQRLAGFLGDRMLGRRFDPSQLIVLAGAAAVLEALFFALADPGDGVLVPTPSYAGFWLDLESRDELSIVPVHTSSSDGFRLTTELLDRAMDRADRPIRALLFTTPNNPLGRVYTADEIDTIVTWCTARGIHAVFDEIYALSVFGDRRFTSVAERCSSLGDLVHIVWAFSKDFGMSGFRSGVLISENEQVLSAIQAQAMWAATSGDTQFVLSEMIGDAAWIDAYIPTMQDRLRRAHASTAAALEAHAIPHQPTEAGFFLLLDLRRFLASASWSAEDALWRQLLHEGNVNVTPGSACHNLEPGFFRLCFASEPEEAVVAGIERIARILRTG